MYKLLQKHCTQTQTAWNLSYAVRPSSRHSTYSLHVQSCIDIHHISSLQILLCADNRPYLRGGEHLLGSSGVSMQFSFTYYPPLAPLTVTSYILPAPPRTHCHKLDTTTGLSLLQVALISWSKWLLCLQRIDLWADELHWSDESVGADDTGESDDTVGSDE